MKIMKVAFYTLGCKLNYSETSTISRYFLTKNYKIVDFKSFSDIYIINTCSVTIKADKDLQKIVNLALKFNNKAYIIAVGCYSQVNHQELMKIKGLNLILGNYEKFKVINYINDIYKKSIKPKVYVSDIKDSCEYVGSYSMHDRTRSFLKIQDGCNYNCSYCTIPLARGVSRSDSLNNILKNINHILDSGVKEIVLSGVNIGDYNFVIKNNKIRLIDLLQKIDAINKKKRIRISSIEPNLLSNEIIDFIYNSTSFVHHFHIPLQSGSDFILNKMRRRYLKSLYIDKVVKIKKLMNNACIGSDVIVGFPGEKEQDFNETYNLINSLDISYLHVFTYSERINTTAISFNESVPLNIRNKRSKILRKLSLEKKIKFYNNQINSIHRVLFENKNKNGFIYGYTDNYIKVKHIWSSKLVNSFQQVRLNKIDYHDNSFFISFI